jgi:hypothetical protein
MKHGVSEEPIRLGLVTGAIGFEPCDDVRIQAHGDGLLPGPIKLADLCSAPIKNRGGIGKINVFVFFCCDGADVPILLLGEPSQLGAPFVRLGGASGDDANDFLVMFLIESIDNQYSMGIRIDRVNIFVRTLRPYSHVVCKHEKA